MAWYYWYTVRSVADPDKKKRKKKNILPFWYLGSGQKYPDPKSSWRNHKKIYILTKVKVRIFWLKGVASGSYFYPFSGFRSGQYMSESAPLQVGTGTNPVDFMDINRFHGHKSQFQGPCKAFCLRVLEMGFMAIRGKLPTENIPGRSKFSLWTLCVNLSIYNRKSTQLNFFVCCLY